MDRQPSVVEPMRPVPLGRAAGSIVFAGVSYRYPGTEHDALTDVSFELSPGETLALVGQSGAGKSTATRLLLRLDDPSAGRILLDGHDLRDVSITSLRENVTVLPQEALFFDVTVREAIAYGRPGASDREIVEAAQAAGAHQFIERLPQGYDTRIGQRGRGLSGGQRQRLAIARALLRDAPVLVLDEPTTGLDDENATQILESIRHLMAGKTTIIVSHDLHLVRQATRIVVLERGRVVEEGNHEALIASDGLYARLSLARQRDGTVEQDGQDGKPESGSQAAGSSVDGQSWRVPKLAAAKRVRRRERRIVTPAQYESEETDGPPPLPPGAIIAPGYRVVGFLRRGRDLDVYDLWSESRNCRCVGKTVRPDRLEKRDARARLLREGKLLLRLTHPHIVRAYEVQTTPAPLVILETLPGETLSHLLDRRQTTTRHPRKSRTSVSTSARRSAICTATTFFTSISSPPISSPPTAWPKCSI